MSNTELVRSMVDSYMSGDVETAWGLLAEDFTFTSPQDDHIDKAAFMERCFPTAGRFDWQEIRELVATEGNGVFVMYEYQLTTGERHRNTEYIVVRDGRLAETHVFFGGRYDDG